MFAATAVEEARDVHGDVQPDVPEVWRGSAHRVARVSKRASGAGPSTSSASATCSAHTVVDRTKSAVAAMTRTLRTDRSPPGGTDEHQEARPLDGGRRTVDRRRRRHRRRRHGQRRGHRAAAVGRDRRGRPKTRRSTLCSRSTKRKSGVTVTFEPQPEFDTALQAALAAGDPPDFFYVDSFAPAGPRRCRRPGAGPRGSDHRARRHLPVADRGVHLRRHVVLPAQGLLHARPRLQRRHARSGGRRAADEHGGARRRRRGADRPTASSDCRSARARPRRRVPARQRWLHRQR